MKPSISCMRANPFAAWWNFKPVAAGKLVIMAGLMAVSALAAQAQSAATNSDARAQLEKQIAGKWARISKRAAGGLIEEQVSAAALQCIATKNLTVEKAAKITTLSKAVSNRLKRIIFYLPDKKGLTRIDLGARTSLKLTKFRAGKTKNGRPGYQLSNGKIKIAVTFAKLKRGNRQTPIMVEGRALYLKCPTKAN